jgi:hypothetical protein
MGNPPGYKPQHRDLLVYLVEHRARGDRFFADEERSDLRPRQVIWRTFAPERGWTCFSGVKHARVWMHDFGNTRLYTCEHESTIRYEPKLDERRPVGD